MNDTTARDAFEALPLTRFWSKMSESHPYVADVPVKAFLMFPSSTYLCERVFSAVLCRKTKCRARLCMIDDLRVTLSKCFLNGVLQPVMY